MSDASIMRFPACLSRLEPVELLGHCAGTFLISKHVRTQGYSSVARSLKLRHVDLGYYLDR